MTGTTSPTVPVTITIGTSLDVPNHYLTPGSGMTYAVVNSGKGGTFRAATFRSSTNPTYQAVNFAQGTRGFVRVQAPTEPHFTGDEVWTIIGQNTFALENWPGMDVYAYAIPGPPGGLSVGVAAPCPPTSVTVTLRNAQGQIKGSQTVPPAAPYAASFAPAMILGGDVVEVTISYASMPALDYDVVVAPITADPDLKGNQVTGTGPPNTCLVVAAGSVQGYVTASAGANYTDWVTAVASNGGGSFASGPVGLQRRQWREDRARHIRLCRLRGGRWEFRLGRLRRAGQLRDVGLCLRRWLGRQRRGHADRSPWPGLTAPSSSRPAPRRPWGYG